MYRNRMYLYLSTSTGAHVCLLQLTKLPASEQRNIDIARLLE